MSTDPGFDQHELTQEDRRVLTALADFGQARANGSTPWPALDGAIRRDSRNRTIRRTAGTAVAAVLAAAVVLPFTPVRVQPLDELAASLRLRESRTEQAPTPAPDRSSRPDPAPSPKVEGMIQDVTRNPKDYVVRTGDPLPPPGGTKITDAAWLDAAATRAEALVSLDSIGQVPDGRTFWAADDGTTVRAIVGIAPADEPDGPAGSRPEQDPWKDPDDGSPVEPWGWVVLAGPSGTSPGELLIASSASYANRLEPASESAVGDYADLIAVYDPDATALKLARLPRIDSTGAVTTTWHAMATVAPGWWLADASGLPGVGYQFRDGASGAGSLDRYSGSPAAVSGGVEAWMATPTFADLARNGYGTAHRRLGFTARPDGKPEIKAEADAELVALRMPDGGWLVTGELNLTKAPAAEQGGMPGLGLTGDRTTLGFLAAPATRTGGTPLVGFALHDPEFLFMRQVVVWAPPEVTEVRSGSARATVVNGLAVLDVWSGAERTAKNTDHQSVLIEGLDSDGEVIARSRVHEPVSERFGGGPANPHDGWPQTVVAWP